LNQINLMKLGWNDYFQSQADLYPELRPGRVMSQSKDLYRVASYFLTPLVLCWSIEYY